MSEVKENVQPEQAADLAALTAAANGGEVEATATDAAQLQPQLADELAGLIAMAVATLAPMFPSLKKTYTQEVTATAAGAIAAVCNKHGWMQGGMFGEFGEEVACLAIVGPLAFSTYQGIKGDLQAMAKENEKLEAPSKAASPTMDAAAKAVTIGAVQP
jgi:hypothetical protein